MTRSQSQGWHDRVFATYGDACAHCGGQAAEADHIIPVSEGGSPDDLGNGQPLCRPCHATKTAAETARANRRRRR